MAGRRAPAGVHIPLDPAAAFGYRSEMGGRGGVRGATMKYLWLAAPCVVALWAPLYNRIEPQLFGVPFFYWFQLLLVPLSAFGIYFVDRARRD